MKKTIETDIAIIGGGIAGLWLLNRLRQLGYSAYLLESKALGAGQTNKSQGIIHGGMKYALQGVMTDATQAIADMPAVWEECLKGQGAVDFPVCRSYPSINIFGPQVRLLPRLQDFFLGWH